MPDVSNKNSSDQRRESKAVKKRLEMYQQRQEIPVTEESRNGQK